MTINLTENQNEVERISRHVDGKVFPGFETVSSTLVLISSVTDAGRCRRRTADHAAAKVIIRDVSHPHRALRAPLDSAIYRRCRATTLGHTFITCTRMYRRHRRTYKHGLDVRRALAQRYTSAGPKETLAKIANNFGRVPALALPAETFPYSCPSSPRPASVQPRRICRIRACGMGVADRVAHGDAARCAYTPARWLLTV